MFISCPTSIPDSRVIKSSSVQCMNFKYNDRHHLKAFEKEISELSLVPRVCVDGEIKIIFVKNGSVAWLNEMLLMNLYWRYILQIYSM